MLKHTPISSHPWPACRPMCIFTDNLGIHPKHFEVYLSIFELTEYKYSLQRVMSISAMKIMPFYVIWWGESIFLNYICVQIIDYSSSK